MSASNLVRVNLTLPKEIVNEARKKGSISKFAAESMSEALAREKRIEAMEALRKLPPANPEIKDSAKYIHDMRRENEKRLRRIGV